MSSEKNFFLNGEYKVQDWQKIAKIIFDLKKVQSSNKNYIKIDYSQAKIDKAIKIIIDEYNENGNFGFDPYSAGLFKAEIPKFIKIEDASIINEIVQKRIENDKSNKSFLRYLNYRFIHFFQYGFNVLSFASKILARKQNKNFQRQIIFQDVLNSCYTMGIQAIPIIIFLSMAIGIIISLQSAKQLAAFGAQLYSIDLVILSFFKEMSIFVAIIVLAARSGSSVISKIGIMRISDEWDALKILGIKPEQFLLKPKIVAFTVLFPFLAYIACASGIFGGYIGLKVLLQINGAVFWNVLSNVYFSTFTIILIKGPIIGLAIGLICTYEIKLVSINSESIVSSITRGVVYSIFTAILIDMLFNIVLIWM